MQHELHDFRQKLEQVSRELGPVGAIKAGLEFGITDTEQATLRGKGWNHVFFIAKDPFAHYGLRMLPGLATDHWPVVKVIQYNRAVTHAPDWRHLLPVQRLLALGGPPDNLLLLRKSWDEHLGFLQPYFDVLPPFSHVLEKMREGVNQASGFNDIYDLIWNLQDYENGYQRLARQRTALQQGAYDNALAALPETADVWTARSAHLNLQALGMLSTELLKMQKPLLREGLFRAVPFDVESAAVKHQPNAVLEAFMVYPAHLTLWTDFMPRDGETMGEMLFYIQKNMEEKGKNGYAGIAHLEAAALLDEAHHKPYLAWDLLLTAAYWAGKNKPNVLPAIEEAQRYLAGKQRWTDLETYLH